MTTDTKLLPCPFCGANAHFEMDDARWEWVECESCGMQSNRRASLMEDCKPTLADAWNTRAERGQPAYSGEPVAWLDPWTGAKVTTDYDAYGKHGIPLYTAPQPVERKPLPVIELMRIVMDVEQQHHFLRGTTNWASAVGRAIERAHGIEGGQHGAE